MWPVFSPPCLFVRPFTRLFVDVYLYALSLFLSRSKHFIQLFPSHPHPFFLFLWFVIGPETRVETAHWARPTEECCLKLSSMCAWHVSLGCPTDTHFMLMACLGSAISRRREPETCLGGEMSHSAWSTRKFFLSLPGWIRRRRTTVVNAL